ncbi:MAG: SUMF1/EgtB/PvdO family nonheme iron enzyme [Anaerolineae bacterium]|nr:SUMF1/EgtB/PvdO family nonheme iron enzyme [Anaerolineae bacterium]
MSDVDAMRLCVVPPGPFCMGSAKDEPNAFEDEQPQTPEFDVSYGYAIGQYPVSNAHYQTLWMEGAMRTRPGGAQP